MKPNEKIKNLRELNDWSQEKMAEKMQMSKNGYARLERGESKMSLERLAQIADIFGLDIIELLTKDYERAIFLVNGQSTAEGNINYYSNNELELFSLQSEIEKLKLIITHKNELLAQKDKEIELLKKMNKQGNLSLED
ncbi:helix-turn-helix domain-containing protein [Suttonella ornithocola]|uniref:Transcriptional regulator, y4mF family n=3 Tax=Suttonella ornithocola TaxID=279832 RepID=A0A380MXM7_9GAMM|nr:helix-turn-helix transcriptional regulator [Suttonella ornithocola]SUO97325.1 transcriptional regulator, y4mF family [Suttonella ornithocola]